MKYLILILLPLALIGCTPDTWRYYCIKDCVRRGGPTYEQCEENCAELRALSENVILPRAK